MTPDRHPARLRFRRERRQRKQADHVLTRELAAQASQQTDNDERMEDDGDEA